MRWLAGFALLFCSLSWGRAPVLVIDPGHGGHQDGAAGRSGALEKTVALQVAEKLRAQLQITLGAHVVLTREKDKDLPLGERVDFANRQDPDAFISIHANSMPTQRQRERIEGIETFFLSANASGAEAKKTAARENAEVGPVARKADGDTLAFILADLQRSEAHGDSSRLAYAVHQELVAGSGATDRGVQQAPFYVLMGVEAPAILVEVGFISHPTEGARLADERYQETLAASIAAGVKAFLEQVDNRDRKRAKLARP